VGCRMGGHPVRLNADQAASLAYAFSSPTTEDEDADPERIHARQCEAKSFSAPLLTTIASGLSTAA
jgi:hypothetical protein